MYKTLKIHFFSLAFSPGWVRHLCLYHSNTIWLMLVFILACFIVYISFTLWLQEPLLSIVPTTTFPVIRAATWLDFCWPLLVTEADWKGRKGEDTFHDEPEAGLRAGEGKVPSSYGTVQGNTISNTAECSERCYKSPSLPGQSQACSMPFQRPESRCLRETVNKTGQPKRMDKKKDFSFKMCFCPTHVGVPLKLCGTCITN